MFVPLACWPRERATRLCWDVRVGGGGGGGLGGIEGGGVDWTGGGKVNRSINQSINCDAMGWDCPCGGN